MVLIDHSRHQVKQRPTYLRHRLRIYLFDRRTLAHWQPKATRSRDDVRGKKPDRNGYDDFKFTKASWPRGRSVFTRRRSSGLPGRSLRRILWPQKLPNIRECGGWRHPVNNSSPRTAIVGLDSDTFDEATISTYGHSGRPLLNFYTTGIAERRYGHAISTRCMTHLTEALFDSCVHSSC